MAHIPNGNSSIIRIIKFYYNGNLFLLPYSMSVTRNWIFQEASICLGVTQASPLLWGKLSPTVQAQLTAFPSDRVQPPALSSAWDLEPPPKSSRPGKGTVGHRNCRSKGELAQREARKRRRSLHMDRMAQKWKILHNCITTNYGDISDLVLSITDYNM